MPPLLTDQLKEKTRRDARKILAIDVRAVKDVAVECLCPDDSERLVERLQQLQAHVKDAKKAKLTYEPMKKHTNVEVGDNIPLVDALSSVLAHPKTGTTAISSVEASSSAARQLSRHGKLRTFHVGQVLVIENGDQFSEDWFVLLTEVYGESLRDADRTVVGVGVWLYGQECMRGIPGGRKRYKIDDDREVYLSDYRYEVKLETIKRVCRFYPAFLDVKREEDVVIRSAFKYAPKTLHALTDPGPMDVPKLLLLLRSIALRAHTVRTRYAPFSTCFVFFNTRGY